MSWSSHPQHLKSGNFENNNNHFHNAHIKREQNPSPQPSSMDCQIDSQFTNILTPSPQGSDTRMFFGDGSSMSVNNNHLMRFNPLTPPGLPNASFPQANFPYEMQQNQQHQNISTSQRNNHQIIETPSITPPMDETLSKSPKSTEEDDKNGDTTSGDEKLDSDVDYSAIYKPQYNSHGKMRTHKCKRCDFVAETKAGYWIHIEVHMNPAKILKCPHYPKCRFVTELKHYLEYHIRLHKNEKPFRCEKCNYRCINKSMLNSHMKSHSGLYQYHCKDCDYATKYCHSLKKHLRKYEHEPGDVLDEDGNPDPSIIVDVNGRRRGPKGRKGRTPKSSKIGMKSLLHSRSLHQKQQSITKTEIPSIQDSRLAAILMGQNRNIMNNFLPNTLANVLQHNENLQYNVVFPYLQMLAGHQAALARLAPPEKSEEDKNLDDNNETYETINAMDLSQTPRKSNRVEELDEEEDDMKIEINSTRSGANTPIITSSSTSKRKGRTLDLEQSSNEETNASSIDDNELNQDNKFQKVSTTSSQEISNDKTVLSETYSNFSNVESLIGSTNCKTDKSLTTRKGFHKNGSRESNIPDVSELYSCKHCDIHFKSVVLHSLHMGFHSCDDVFKCNMCGEQCTTAIELFVHLARKPHNDV